jgi:hypothetical protein
MNKPIGHSEGLHRSGSIRLSMAWIVQSALVWVNVKKIIPFAAAAMQRAHGPIVIQYCCGHI